MKIFIQFTPTSSFDSNINPMKKKNFHNKKKTRNSHCEANQILLRYDVIYSSPPQTSIKPPTTTPPT